MQQQWVEIVGGGRVPDCSQRTCWARRSHDVRVRWAEVPRQKRSRLTADRTGGQMPEGACRGPAAGTCNSRKRSGAAGEVWWRPCPHGRRGWWGQGSAEEESWAQGALGAGRGWLGGAVVMQVPTGKLLADISVSSRV